MLDSVAQASARSQRRLDIDIGKIIGIFLVVFGHIYGRQVPPGGEWWYTVSSYIYSFHMPFFIFLSGYVFFWRSYHTRALEDYPRFLRERAFRLLVPFLAMAVVIVVGKVAVARVSVVDAAPEGLLDGFWKVLNLEDQSPVRFIWFVITIFYYSAVTPWLVRATGTRAVVLVPLGLVMLFAPAPSLLYLDNAVRYYLFFLLGGLAAQSPAFDRATREYGLFAIAAFALASAAFLMVAAGTERFYYAYWSVLLVGGTSCLGLMALARRLDGGDRRIVTLSKFVFTIYLFNVPAIGLTKAALVKLLPFDAGTMLIYAPLLLLGGLVIPAVLKAVVFSRVPVLDRLTSS